MAELVKTGDGKAFLGRVRYAPVEDLGARAAKLVMGKQVTSSAATGLHWKRSQFVLEREVRLLWVTTVLDDNPFYSLSFDTNTSIDQVMIGPTIDPKQVALARKQLRDAGVPERLIRRSLIYAEAK
jgi:hypothetical protein